MEYLIKQYALEPGAWEIRYIEEFFGEFRAARPPTRSSRACGDRESLILMAEAPLPDDPDRRARAGVLQDRPRDPRQRIDSETARPGDALSRLSEFDGRRILYSWIGGTRRDWRGQGHFRALTEESEVWAMGAGFEEVVVKAKNRYYDMRAVLASLQFNVVKHEPHASDTSESKIYLSKLLPPKSSVATAAFAPSCTPTNGPQARSRVPVSP